MLLSSDLDLKDEREYKEDNRKVSDEIVKQEEKLSKLNKELENHKKLEKLSFKQLPEYSFDVFKGYVKDYLELIRIHSVEDERKFQSFFPNKQEVLSLIEIKPRITGNDSIYFILSQRSYKMLFVSPTEKKGDILKQIQAGKYQPYFGDKNGIGFALDYTDKLVRLS